MAVNLSPIGNDAPFVDASGNPLSGGKLYTYTAGSSTAQNTYTTSAGSVANANPIILDSNGYPASGGNVVEIWLTAGVSYKFVLETSASVVVWTRDNISGINDTTVTIDQWVAGPAPTYISATSFSLVGDQTTDFHVGRRIKTTNSGGTIYSTILTSAYTTLTTITVINDSGTLDSGLSAVSYGVVSADNTSEPLLVDTYPIRSGSTDKTKKLKFELDTNVPTGTTLTVTPGAGGILPAGIGPLPYAGGTVPTGWLECDGTAVSRTTYAALYTAIGTTWGAGDGSTTFNLPNMKGRVPVCDGTGTVTEDITASSSNGFTVASNNTKWITGMAVVVSNITGFTTSVSAGTYYVYRVSATNVRLCSTLAIAQNATTGSMETVSGTGTITFTTTFTARTLGSYGGEETHAMSITELLSHPHQQNASTLYDLGSAGGTGALGRQAGGALNTDAAGGNAGMNIMQPFAVTKYIISY